MKTGFLLGKFLPPHRGHLYLIEQAAARCDHLTVLMCSIQRELIPGALRFAWLTQLCPYANVVHCTDENPQYPQEHPDFWQFWMRSIRNVMPSGPDLVFSSEDYGDELAERLGARHVLIDRPRSAFPVSGTSVRESPQQNWHLIPAPVQEYYRSIGRVAAQ